MKKISIILTCLALTFSSLVFAQNDIDALRYSQSSLTGTARYVSMGGAFGALGADFSTLSYNPAGIGLYNKSEFTFTPSVYWQNTTSNFLSQTGMDGKSNFNFGNIGMVFSKRLSPVNANDGWQSINFGIGYNRLNNFNTRSFYQGVNNNNSYLDNILYGDGINPGANGTAPEHLDAFYQDLAYQTYLINNDDPLHPDRYTSVIPNAGELQRRSSETWGSSGETVISLGTNYGNRLYIGATLGLDYLHYYETTNYQEIDQDNSIYDFNNFNLTQHLSSYGFGVNFKFGMIFKATDWMRLGGAINTETSYSMHDDYHNDMASTFDDHSSYSYSSPYGSFDYHIGTPFKAIGSVAFIVGKAGIISADYEYLDYSNMHVQSYNPSDFYDVNNAIVHKYTSTGNIKVGTEWKVGSVYRVRAGYAFFGSPFATGEVPSEFDQSKSSYTLGFGVRDKNYFVDLGYAYSISHDYYQPYYLSYQDVPGVYNKVVTNNILLTVGLRF